MRKKELLSLYVVQKDNLNDDSSCGLPAASDSLPLGPDFLRKSEEEEDVSTGNGNGSKRFKKNSSSRELRALDANSVLVEDQQLAGASGGGAGTASGDGRRRSACSSGSNNDNNGKTGAATSAGKRRGRSKTLESSEDDHQTPKLKIKIRGLSGSEAVASAGISNAGDSKSYSYEMTRRACPPKKRLTSNYSTPTLEEIKRDSMNYRKKVMQDFDKGEENNKQDSSGLPLDGEALMPQPPSKRPKSSKPKKDKKEKKRQKQKQLILNSSSATTTMTTTLIENTASASPGDKPKLILRINKRKTETSTKITCLEQPPVNEAPLRLKIARNLSGGGYIIGAKAEKKEDPPPDPPPDPNQPNVSPANELPLMAPLGETSPQGLLLNSFTPHSQNANASPALLGKDSGTPSPPCLVIDSSKSADVHDSTSLPESGVAAMGVPVSLVGATTPLCVNVGNYENSNNSLPSASGTGSASSNSCNSNSNNNNNNGSGGGAASGGGSLLPLKKDCEVR
ncbi:GL16110 [Drosophila persimilis]|uniref:GL16110 n=2 Tax=Drosophila persimilis TaxID=7234 RepID=B4H5C1_DROPE|nr:GL16110 [Drosophila persimilis]